jgi:hypothetical protein
MHVKMLATYFWDFNNGRGFQINWRKKLHCTHLEKGVGDGMIHLLGTIGTIMKK